MAKKRKTNAESSSGSDTSSATRISGPASKQSLSHERIQDEDSQESAEENLKVALLDWLKSQPQYNKKSPDVKKTQENAIKDLADGLISVVMETPDSDDSDSILLQEIKKHTQKFPVDSKNKTNDELPTQLLEHLKSLKPFQDILKRHDQSSVIKEPKKKATVILLEDIADWVKKLPIETGTSEEIENTKEQLESKIVHKIGELNMNSEIFNDDFIYDDILGDEVENLLSNLPDENIKSNLTSLKRELLAITMKARKKIRNENAGQIYKKQLCEAISNVLPTFDLDVEGKASFEVLKDDVADAFISMCYVGNDEEEKNRLRKKTNDEIYRFCNKYLKRCPASPFDTTKINQALYCALRCIAEPQNETFTDDIELVKIKDEINKWLEELPLKNHAGQEKLHTNRLISVLAKNIHDIENEKEFITPEEYEEKLNKEIDKFLKKIPLTTENDDDLNELTEKITTSLKDTEECRKLNASSRQCNQPLGNKCSKAKLRISFNDVSVSPCPVDTCIQTSSSSKICPAEDEGLTQKNSSVQTPCKRMQAVGSQVNMTPKVIVNEYNWDSIDESSMQSPRDACPCPTESRPPYEVLPQPLQCPGTLTRGDESQMQSFQPSCPAPVRRPCTVMPRRHASPAPQREKDNSTAAMKSCITSRPYALQPFQNKFKKPRDPDQINPCNCAHYQTGIPTSSEPNYNYDDYDDELPENSEQYEGEAARECSNQSIRSVNENNSCQRRKEGNQQSAPCNYPPTSSPCPPYPYHLSTAPAPERRESMSQRRCPHSQSNQYSKQPYSCTTSREGTGQRNVIESQYIPYTPCQGTPQSRNQLHQDSQPMTSSPFMNSCPPHFSQGPSRITPRSSMYAPSAQMPCASTPRTPCYMRMDPPPSEDYDPGFDCSLDFEYWDRDADRTNFEPVDQNNLKGKCKVCKRTRRYSDCNGKRY